MSERSTKAQLASVLGVMFMLFMLTSLGLRFLAGQRMVDISGPTHISANADRVLVHMSDSLYDLAPDGTLHAVHRPASTGLDGDLIDLRLLTDGRVLLALQSPARLKICDIENWECATPATGIDALAERQYKIIPMPSAVDSGWLLSDARGDRLWRIGTAGTPPIPLLQSGELAGPNDLLLDAAGRLWIADTDHRQISLWKLTSGNGADWVLQHSAMHRLTRNERHFPMMLAEDGQHRLWVIQASEYSQGTADVIIFGSVSGSGSRSRSGSGSMSGSGSGSAEQFRVELPGSVYPTDLVAQGRRMLITDLETFAVYAVDTASLATELFGNQAFIQALAEQAGKHAKWRLISNWALAGVIAFAVLMLVAGVAATQRGLSATRKGRRFALPVQGLDLDSAPEKVLQSTGIHWLAVEPRFKQLTGMLGAIGLIVPVLLILTALAFFAAFRSEFEALGAEGAGAGTVLLLAAMAMVVLTGALMLVLRRRRRTLSNRLGSDGRHIWLRLHDGRTLSIDPADAAQDGWNVLYRAHMAALGLPRGHGPYRNGETEKWLAPLLRQSDAYGPWQSLQHRWRHREGQLMSLLVFAAAIAIGTALVVWIKLLTG